MLSGRVIHFVSGNYQGILLLHSLHKLIGIYQVTFHIYLYGSCTLKSRLICTLKITLRLALLTWNSKLYVLVIKHNVN